ncbi:MoxR family ATPase, partial [Alteromonas sp. 14N.309.X.WAT.G.H12]|uniref:AAA family ATPase n=1 Tax=Alteromonas sp. 14N.309.X.WAT.G.H12 TaxID=3120824 RepID=UPI002FD0A0C1
PTPFFVIATQNPSYQSGTYPLPESQLDRFLMRISLGYPSYEAEKQMLTQSPVKPLKLADFISPSDLIEFQRQALAVTCSDSIIHYILKLVNASREQSTYPQPLSPRASKALLRAAKAWAFLHDRNYVLPEDVQAVFTAVAEHRLKGVQQEWGEENVLSQRLLDSVDPLAA